MLEQVHHDLLSVALSKVSGSGFEAFCNEFFPTVLGVGFAPLGGAKDGGADAFLDDPLFERIGDAKHFFQASIVDDYSPKICKTVERLRDFGRDVQHLTYLSSRTIRYLDRVEDELSRKTSTTIRIRDAAYIAAHINSSATTIGAFDRQLRPLTAYLNGIGSSNLLGPSVHVSDPAVFVFLRQAIDRLDGDLSLTDAMTDALILWALEGTDPDTNTFMTTGEVTAKLLDRVPAVVSIVGPRLWDRIQALSDKGYPGGRQVNWHRADDNFCLPYDTRRKIGDENAQDEALRLRVHDGLIERANDVDGLDPSLVKRVGDASLRVLQLAFEQEGLEFSHFLENSDTAAYPRLGDLVKDAVDSTGTRGAFAADVASGVLTVARACMYGSTGDEREYLGKLARTYALLFTLSVEPRLVDYFQQMGADFYLYVGSDILVRALSERYLPEQDRLCKNVLTIASRGGAKLILAEPVLDEVLGNIRASDFEYLNHVSTIEHRLVPEMIREVPKILLRAYLYNKGKAHGPSSWQGFVEQFLSYGSLHKPQASTQLKHYFAATFGMEFRSVGQLEALADASDLAGLETRLATVKKDERLARNDALMVCAVYGHREHSGEHAFFSEFGYRTWWLTNETAVMREARELIRKRTGDRFIMRPEFLLNFYAFAPKASEVRRTFSSIFPTSLGIQLSKRMDEAAFHGILQQVREAEQFDDARRAAVMAECVDKLKTDFDRRYLIELGR